MGRNKKRKKYFYIAGLVSILFILLILINILKPRWSLFFYPNGCLGCVDDWIIHINSYYSKEDCRDAGYQINAMRGYGLLDTFECGYKCEIYDESGYLCKKTVDF